MTTYALLLALGLAIAVIGFVTDIRPLAIVGVLVAGVGFLVFVRRGQGSDPRSR